MFILVLLSCTDVSAWWSSEICCSCPIPLQFFRRILLLHFFQAPSVGEHSQHSPVQGEPQVDCLWRSEVLLQRSNPETSLPFPCSLVEGLYGCCGGCQASSMMVFLSPTLPTVHTCLVCCSLLPALFGWIQSSSALGTCSPSAEPAAPGTLCLFQAEPQGAS